MRADLLSQLQPTDRENLRLLGVECPRAFEKFAGEDVRITTRMPVGDRRNFNGPLLGVDGQNVRIKQDGKEVSLPHSEITKANLIHRWGNKRKAS